jgi:ATP-dependent protease ClpP protease subunit
LAAGAKGNRAALPSSTIMMKQIISLPFVDRDNILIYILDDHTVSQYLDDDSRIIRLNSSS